MMRIVFDLGLFGLFTATISAVLALAGLLRFLRQRQPPASVPFAPPVSLLKPLDGAEPNLEAHIESFFSQNYSNFEVLFCARSATDPGLEAARRVAARYPHIPAQFLSTGEQTWINAKVSSLELMDAAARHDILIISDSDVRVAPGYLRAVAQPFADPSVGAVTCPYRGIAAEGGLWARLEAVGMSVEMTAGVLAAQAVEGMQFVLGPTMAFRREIIRRLGGFRVTADYCADDFILGNETFNLGAKVVLSHYAIDHMVINSGFMATIKHQVRWMKSTRFSRPKGHLGTALTFSIPFGLLAWAAAAALGHPWWGIGLFGWSLATRIALALAVGRGVVRDPSRLGLLILYPLRDLMGFCFWAASYLSNRIVWRDRILELLPGGKMRLAK